MRATATAPGNDGLKQHSIMSDSAVAPDAGTGINPVVATDAMLANRNGIDESARHSMKTRQDSNRVELKMARATFGAEDREGGDEAEYVEIAVADLSFKDEKYKDSFLARLNTLRRNREMCDVVLLVGQREIHAHKAVLAAVSPTLFDLLSPSVGQQQNREESPTSFVPHGASGQGALTNGHLHAPARPAAINAVASNEKSKQSEQQHHGNSNGVSTADSPSPTYLEFNDVDFDCFEALVNYAYSGCLEINSRRVADLYKTSSRFRMQSCAEACAKYLVKQLSPQNCIGVRKCANRTNDFLLACKVDSYIQKNFAEISQKSKEFLALPVIQIEVVLCIEGRPEIAGPMKEERRLGEKVIDWLQQQVHDLPEHAVFRMEMLTQKVHMLYLDEDLILQDCQDMDDSTTMGSSDMIQDYKKSSRRNVSQAGVGSKLKSKVSCQPGASPGPKIARFASTDSMNSLASDNEEVEWKIIAVVRSSENYYTALSIVRRHLAALTIRLVDSAAFAPGAPGFDPDAVSAYSVKQMRQADLAFMGTPRCSVGAVCLDGKLIVCGGYDRGECLRTVEQYDPVTNCWRKLPDMHKERGRFDASVLDNKIYAVGGSDGTRDLQCAERYDPNIGKWIKIAQMHNPRSNHGVTTADGRVYVIGGCQGQNPVKQCERYDLAMSAWEPIAPLQHARFQAGCCAWSDQVIVVSGCNMWNCINTVECYDPTTNVWRFLPPLSSARRGCGVAVMKGKLYVFGGSDGIHSLCSMEVLDLTDPQAKWKPGPPLTTPRGNVRAVVLPTPTRGDILFAVGGFNGKSFLNTIEYFEEGATDWKTTVINEPSWANSFQPTAISSTFSTVAHNHLSLNRAKFVIDEDPAGESQDEVAVLTGSADLSKPSADEKERGDQVG